MHLFLSDLTRPLQPYSNPLKIGMQTQKEQGCGMSLVVENFQLVLVIKILLEVPSKIYSSLSISKLPIRFTRTIIILIIYRTSKPND